MYGELRRLFLSIALLLFGMMLAPRLWAGDGNNNFRLVVTDAPDDSANSNIRDIISGSDLDQDGKYEIIITDYSYGGRAHVYEVVSDNTLEWVWSSPGTDSPEWAPARAVQVADLDADGYQEILLSICQSGAAPGTAGLHVFEWDGMHDNGYGSAPIAVIPIDATLGGGFTEDFAIDDLDGDQRQEILYLNRGDFEWNRCYVLSIAGSFESSWSMITEAVYRQETGDLDGDPWDVVVSDLDGDGFKEAIYALRDGGAGLFIVEATGPNSYAPATTLHINPNNNGYSLEGMAAADVNGDGKDELYVTLHQGGNVDPSGPLIVVTSGDDVAVMTFAENVRYLRDDGVGCYGLAIGDQDHGAGSDGPDIYVTSFGSESVGGFIQDFEFVGSDVRDPNSYIEHVIFQDLAPTWPGGLFQLDIPRVDLDGDGQRELVVSYTGETATGVYFRIFEFDARTSTVFLADKITLKRTKQDAPAGDMHSNGTLTVEKGDPSTYYSNLTAVGKITILKENTINGDVTSATAISNSGTINGTRTIGPVNTEPLPCLSYSAGGANKTVPSGGVLALPPGSYNVVTLKSGGTLKLTSGEYFMNELRYSGSEAVIEIDLTGGEEAAINVVKNLQLGKEVAVQLLPNGESASKLVTFNTLQSTAVSLGKEAYCLGNFNAPNAKVTLEKNGQLRGALCAKEILVERDCLFLPHDSPSSLPGPGNLPKEFDSNDPEVAGNQEPVTNYRLEQNYPNPFNPTTEIRFALPKAGPVVLRIFNTLGEEIRTLVDAPFESGYHTVPWDGKDKDGKPVASGVYLYQLRAGEFSQVRKMSLIH